MKYDVTVSIVNYNDYSRVKEAIRSILEYTRGIKIKIYVVDNASSDSSADKIANEFSNVSVILCDRNLGYGSANNIVIKHVDSKYHAIINPDILLRSNALKELYDFMNEHKDVGMCMPAVFFKDGNPQYLPKRDPKLKYLIANRMPGLSLEKYRKHYTMQDEDLSRVRDIEFISGCFMFAQTELLKEAGGFDERFFMYFEDADLSRTIRRRTRLVYVPQVHVYHDYRRISAKKVRFFMIHITSMFKYFFKWRNDDPALYQRSGLI